MCVSLRHICVLLALVALVNSVKVSKATQETVQKCMEETGTTADDVKDATEGKEPSAAFKCLIKCCMKAHNWISEEGLLNKEVILGSMSADYKTWLEGCIKDDGPGHACDVSYDFNKCLSDSDAKKYKEMADMENV